MKISLVINTYNRMHTLPTTLRSLEFLRYPDLEVIVVDGPSTDGTLEYLRTHWDKKVKICICSEANLSKSRNIGIANASGDIICFTDDDGVPEADWLNKLVTAYEDPKVGAAGGWVRNHTGVDYQTKYIISSRASTSDVLIEDTNLVPESIPHAEKFPGLIGVSSSFRRTSLLEVGGFDEVYTYFLDETDVLARLIDAGYSVKMVRDAEVHHKYAPSHIRNHNGSARSWLQIIKSTAYYIVKNATPGTPLSVSMQKIASQKQNLISNTNWQFSQNMIDRERHSEMLREIEQGADQGIRDSFKYPSRQLLAKHDKPTWLQFPRPLDFNNRLRLAFVTALYPPRPCGGVAVFICNLAKALANLGHEITVITQADNGQQHTVDFEDGVWVHRIPADDSVFAEYPSHLPDMPNQPRETAGKVLAELNRVNARRRFQYVIGTIWDLDIAAVVASKAYRTAMYLVTSYKLMEDSKPEWKENQDFYVGHVKKMIDAEIWTLANVDHVLASTKAILRDTELAYNLTIDDKKLEILPFGVPPATVKSLLHDSDTIKLLFVGRFEHRKGADLLLEVLPQILANFPNMQVTCIGDNSIISPSGKSYLEDFLNIHKSAVWIDQIRFLGHVDDQALETAYSECDIFVAPSRYESFGLIYLEAMRYGKCCIGTTAGGIPEVVIAGETGILIPPNDASSLKSVIEELATNKKLRLTLGENGRRRYEELFTTERFALNFESLLKKWINI